MATPLTTHLQTLHPSLFTSATTHPFLTHSGQGTLPKHILSQWLSQDHLYAQSYVRFIGGLLAKIHLPAHNPDSAKPCTATAEHRAVNVLIDALVNIRTEMEGFEDVAKRFGLDLEALPREDGTGTGTGVFGPNPITHSYIDLFMSASSPATSVLEGLVVLWATEICYLRAWQYAASVSSSSSNPDTDTEGDADADGGALRQHFIPSWTSPEFESFVTRIGDVVDEMAGLVKGAEAREYLVGRCGLWWRQVLYLEARFWPDVSL